MAVVEAGYNRFFYSFPSIFSLVNILLGIAWGFNFKLPKFCCVKQHRFNALM